MTYLIDTARATLTTTSSSADIPRRQDHGEQEVETRRFHTDFGRQTRSEDSPSDRRHDLAREALAGSSTEHVTGSRSSTSTTPRRHQAYHVHSHGSRPLRDASNTPVVSYVAEVRTRSGSTLQHAVTSVVNGLRHSISTKRKYLASPQRSYTNVFNDGHESRQTRRTQAMGETTELRSGAVDAAAENVPHLVNDIPQSRTHPRSSPPRTNFTLKPALRLRTVATTPSVAQIPSDYGPRGDESLPLQRPPSTPPRRTGHGHGLRRPFSPISPAKLAFRDISPRQLLVAPTQPDFNAPPQPDFTAAPPRPCMASLDQTLRGDECIGYHYITSNSTQLSVATIDPLSVAAWSQSQSKPDRLARKYSTKARDQALAMPEVVECILQQLDAMACEANSIGGKRRSQSQNRNSATTATKCDAGEVADGDLELKGAVSACLYVNKTWSDAARRVLSNRVEFNSLVTFAKYVDSAAARDNLCRDLLIHKTRDANNTHLAKLNQTKLRSIEFYVCPELTPPVDMLVGGSVRRLALPGCSLSDDALMEVVARSCPRLTTLDLRACERVSDVGVVAVAKACRELRYLNVGRMQAGERITDVSLEALCAYTSIETVGLAGCDVTDTGVLAIARLRYNDISRVSLNQCRRVTSDSIVQLVKTATKLKVLELVGCSRVQAYEALLEFKQATGALVDVDSELGELMVQLQLYRARSRRGGGAMRGVLGVPSSVAAATVPTRPPSLPLGTLDLRLQAQLAAEAALANTNRARLSGIAQARAQVALA